MVNSGLDSLVQEFVECETQNVIQLELVSSEEAISMHSVEEGGTFEQSPGVLLFESEQFSGCLSELGEDQMDSPYFSLVFEAVLAYQLKLMIDSFLFEGSSWSVKCRGIYAKKGMYSFDSFFP